MARIVIIGSWFGGLSAAIHCAHAGHDVVVYEKNEQLWGRASVLEKNGFRRDMGPSRYLMPDVFEAFFQQFGKKRSDYLQIEKLSPGYRVFFMGTDKKQIDVYDDVERNRAIFESLEPWSTDVLKTYLQQAAYQYEVAMRDFVPKNYDSIFDFFNRRMAVEGIRLHVFEKMSRYVKRFFKTPMMQKIMQYPLVFLGTAPNDAPALYNIMTYVDFGMGVRYPKGGIYAVIEALVTLWHAYGVSYHTNTEVSRIVVENGRTTGVELAGGEFVSADRVISNADYHRTETKLLDSKRQTYTESYRKKRVMAPSGFMIYLGIKGAMKSLLHHTLLFCEDRDQNFADIFVDKQPPSDPSIYVCCPSKTDATVAPEGYENMFILVPFPPDVYLTDDQIQVYKQKVYTMLERETGELFQDRIVEEHVFTAADFQSRYHAYQGSALWLAHTLRQTAIFRPNTISKKVKNLLYAWGYTNPWIGMPMCLISGKLAFERIQE